MRSTQVYLVTCAAGSCCYGLVAAPSPGWREFATQSSASSLGLNGVPLTVVFSVPSMRSRCVIPAAPLSLAEVAMLSLPETTVPLSGLVLANVGGVVSADGGDVLLETLSDTGEDKLELPAAS